MDDFNAPTLWIQRNLKIIDKNGLLIGLNPNIGQLMLARMIYLQRQAGFPVRIILLKPRQVGWSTWCEAEGFYYINVNENRTALVVSADLDSTNMVFNMTKLYQDQMPLDLKRATKASTRKEIIFEAPHRSKFLTQTAGKDVLGRGGTVHFLHLSEVAFWPKAKEGLASILQMVPDKSETTVIWESTANGVGGAFYDNFQQAVDRWRTTKSYQGYIPVFFPWYKFPEYQTTPPRGFKKEEEEIQIAREFKISDAQIFWRRLKIQELGGDEALFRQEYPATHIEAFQTSGNPVFTAKMLHFQKAFLQPARNAVFNTDEIENVQRSFNCWKIVNGPIESHQYCMGIDTMEGRLSDIQDPKSNLDCNAAVVLDRTTGQVAAAYHGRGNQKDFGYQCLWAAQCYNDAWVAPEIPHSMTLLNVFKEFGYNNIYNRQVHDQRISVQESENLGWRTDLITRHWLTDDFVVAMRDGSVKVQIKDILDEMETFIRDKNGKPVHQPGKHDDLLFALMIALQVHQRCPLTDMPYLDDYTGEGAEIERPRTLTRSGVIDDCILEEDEE
jgi:hypothetical protein